MKKIISEVHEVGTIETKSYMRENINFKNIQQQFHCILLGSFYYPHLYQDKLPSVYPNHTQLSAVTVTKATTLNDTNAHSTATLLTSLNVRCTMNIFPS